MESRRLFSSDPESGVTKYWHYDPDTDRAVIQTQQDVSQIIDTARANHADSYGRRFNGFMQHVGYIPLAIYAEWMASGKHRDQASIRKFLNDPDNRYLRTFRGRV